MSIGDIYQPLVFIENRTFLCCDKEGVIVAYEIVEEGGKLSVKTSDFMRKELGVPIERIAGSSSGKVVACKSATQVFMVDSQRRAIVATCDINPQAFNARACMSLSSDGTYFVITSHHGFVQVYRAD